MSASIDGKDTHTQSPEQSTKSSFTKQELMDFYDVESFVPIIAKNIMASLSAAPSEAIVRERQDIKRARGTFLHSAIQFANKDEKMRAEAQRFTKRWKELPLEDLNHKKSRGIVQAIQKYENSLSFDKRIKEAADKLSISCQSIKVTLDDHLKKRIPTDAVLSEEQVRGFVQGVNIAGSDK